MTYDPNEAIQHLRSADPIMAAIIDRVGPFAMRADSPNPLRALARSIIFQQLSGKAAGTIYGRFLALFSESDLMSPSYPQRSSPHWDPEAEPFPRPEAILALSDEQFRSAGMSRPKTRYVRELAAHFLACDLCPEFLYEAPEEDIFTHLTAIPGVGRWTVEMFLIFHLRRPDILPVNDLGINRAIKHQYGLEAMPRPPEVLEIGQPWRPYASVACWYLWRSEDTVVLP